MASLDASFRNSCCRLHLEKGKIVQSRTKAEELGLNLNFGAFQKDFQLTIVEVADALLGMFSVSHFVRFLLSFSSFFRSKILARGFLLNSDVTNTCLQTVT